METSHCIQVSGSASLGGFVVEGGSKPWFEGYGSESLGQSHVRRPASGWRRNPEVQCTCTRRLGGREEGRVSNLKKSKNIQSAWACRKRSANLSKTIRKCSSVRGRFPRFFNGEGAGGSGWGVWGSVPRLQDIFRPKHLQYQHCVALC